MTGFSDAREVVGGKIINYHSCNWGAILNNDIIVNSPSMKSHMTFPEKKLFEKMAKVIWRDSLER